MVLHPAFQGHGTFCYVPIETMNHYDDGAAGASPTGRAARVARAFKEMGMAHAWLRLFGLEGTMDRPTTKELIDALRAEGIHVAGWGYCHGRNTARDLARAKEEADRYGLEAFIADIEPGRLLDGTKAKWDESEISDFIDSLGETFGESNLGISTWPVLRIQNDPQFPSLKLMKKVADRVAMFAPQAYWMSYPKNVHYHATGFIERDYPRNDPVSFVRLVVDSWRKEDITTPLLITAQAYWGEGSPEQDMMEAKIGRFGSAYDGWQKIIGLNWWHAGGSHAMSLRMREALRNARFGDKPYASPEATEPQV